MKQFFAATGLFLSLALPTIAQETAPVAPAEKAPVTKLDVFLAKKGILLIRDDYSTGRIEGQKDDFASVSISAVTVYQPGDEKNKVKGLRFSGYRSSLNGRSEQGIVTLDIEEGLELVKALDYLTDLEGKWTKEALDKKAEKSASFSTKGDFEVSYSVYQDLKMRRISTGDFSMVIDTPEKFTQLKSAVNEGLAWLAKQ